MNLDPLYAGPTVRVGVIGDIMLDVYETGHVSRISPEFPVVILNSDHTKPTMVPGGAANVAAQFRHLNASVLLYGFADPECLHAIEDFGFDVSNVEELSYGMCPRKIRLYDADFPLLRHDREVPDYGVADVVSYRKKVVNRICDDIANGNLDIVVLSNYGKGLFDEHTAQKIISVAGKFFVPTIVDPKNNFHWWTGCTVFKPNSKEADPASFDTLRTNLNVGGVVVTMAGEGVIGTDGVPFKHSPKTKIKDVSSVIGAGDCFAAYLAFATAKGFTLSDASLLAFEAGSEYVRAKHNRPVSLHEVHRRIDPHGAKVVGLPIATYLVKNVLHDRSWAFTNGVFDLMHPGHISSLRFARSQADSLIVGINMDESVSRLKGSDRPIMNLAHRTMMLSAIEDVDLIIPFSEDTPFHLIKALDPAVVVKGQEYEGKAIGGDDYKGKISYAPRFEGLSTTSIISRCRL